MEVAATVMFAGVPLMTGEILPPPPPPKPGVYPGIGARVVRTVDVAVVAELAAGVVVPTLLSPEEVAASSWETTPLVSGPQYPVEGSA